jgi:hypothetical protein
MHSGEILDADDNHLPLWDKLTRLNPFSERNWATSAFVVVKAFPVENALLGVSSFPYVSINNDGSFAENGVFQKGRYASIVDAWLSDPKWRADDMTVINIYTLPGGTKFFPQPDDAADFDEGETLVHELGHWFGLRHVFDDDHNAWLVNDDMTKSEVNLMKTKACAYNSIGPSAMVPTYPLVVDDITPYWDPESGIKSCESADTCKNVFMSKNDPIDNYMSYALDRCMKRFTSGQLKTMAYLFQKYRAAPLREYLKRK